MSLSARDKSIVCIALALSIVSHVNDDTTSADDQPEAGTGPSMRGTSTVAAIRLNDQHGSDSSACTMDAAINRCISSSRMQLLSDNHNQSRPSEFYASTLINMLLLLDTSINRCDESTQMISDALLRHLLTLPHGGQQLQHVLSYMVDLLVERSIVLLDSGVSPYAFRTKVKSFYDSVFTTMTMTTMTDRSDDYLSLQYNMLDVLIQAVQRIALIYSDAYELLLHYSVYEHMGFLLRLLKDKCALVVHTIIDISAREATATDPVASLLQQGSERPSSSTSSSTNSSSSSSSSSLLRFNDWLSKTLGNACIAPSHCQSRSQ